MDRCLCGYGLVTQSELKNSNECSVSCDGNSQQICGGVDRFSIYSNSPACSKLGTPQRILNPGFENGKAYWSTEVLNEGPIKWHSRQGNQFSGKRVARIDSPSATSSIIFYQTVPVCGGFPYVVSLQARQASDTAGCNIQFVYAEMELGSRFPLATTYQKYEAITNRGGGLEDLLIIEVFCDGDPGSNGFRTTYLDDVEMRPATPAEVMTRSCSPGLICSPANYRYTVYCGEVVTSGSIPNTPVPVSNVDACIAVCDIDLTCEAWSYGYDTNICTTYSPLGNDYTTETNAFGVWGLYEQGNCPL